VQKEFPAPSPHATGVELCREMRERETVVLEAAVRVASRELEALKVKQYYQERRLQMLNLDSPWERNGEGVMGGGGRKQGGELDF
jgi:hypothetical protein